MNTASRREHTAARIALAVTLLIAVSGLIHGQSIPAVDAEETPLHWAAEHGLAGITAGLLANGAAVNAPDQFGRTPLHFAVPYTEVVVLLLDAGANVDAPDMFGRTPLHASLPYPQTAALLIGAGADITAEDFMGDTPLERTLRYGTRSRNLEMINLLLAAGAGKSQASR